VFEVYSVPKPKKSILGIPPTNRRKRKSPQIYPNHGLNHNVSLVFPVEQRWQDQDGEVKVQEVCVWVDG
jgi:hypothetical protein